MHLPEITRIARHECTGCAACANACPHGFIRFESNEEGFLYPEVSSECVGCGCCDNACPILSGQTEFVPEVEQCALAAVSRDPAIRRASSSGGAFSEICKAYGDAETVVFGARFEGMRVVHSYVIGVKNIAPFCKSKYVQSDIGDCFAEAREFLKEGRKVIFSGTPCQLAGLRAFLGRRYERLLCVDIICHGVGSPGVFALAWRDIEKRAGKKLISYTFRNRFERLGNWRDFVCCYEFEDGQRIGEPADAYQRFFLAQLCLRASCGENCKFRNRNRAGDITIADFKGKFHVFPKMMDHRNYSTIIANTKKGNSVCRHLTSSMKVLPCSMNDIERFNPIFFKSTNANPDRERFFKSFQSEKSFDYLEKQFLHDQPAWKKKLGLVKNILIPFHLRRAIRISLNMLKEIGALWVEWLAGLKKHLSKSNSRN
jgi:NAD-dependent dihydropyrimidine dehydrogenase PreA subunit